MTWAEVITIVCLPPILLWIIICAFYLSQIARRP
jgi:hypothetical protein